MFDTFFVTRRSRGLVASLGADRMAPEFDGGDEAAGAAGEDDAHLDAGAGADEGDAVQGDADRTDADDDDDEEFDEGEADADPRETVKKLRNALRKSKTKLGKSRADRQLLKELRDRGFSAQDLYADSREYRRLMETANRNPRLRALLNGSDVDDDAQSGRGSGRRAEADEEFRFDDSEEALGFAKDASPANKAIAAGLRRAALAEFQLAKLVKQLGGDPTQLVSQVRNLDQGIRTQSAAQLNQEWSGAIKAASEHIKDTGVRAMFQDAMLAAKGREGGKRPAAFFVQHYLKLLKVSPATAAKANTAAAAARGRIASNVAGLQRQDAGTRGTPAPAKNAREKLSDVHKRLRNVSTGQRT